MEEALALVRKLQPKNQESLGYTLLTESFRALHKFAILPYDSNAENRFQEFPTKIRRLGRGDCQIAAIALLNNATVITRNQRHFSEIPELRFEDWTE
jgi:tRNA(fMet)-specific endonuclease VapC